MERKLELVVFGVAAAWQELNVYVAMRWQEIGVMVLGDVRDCAAQIYHRVVK